eukprot:TRINITY_DN709_c0_g1_i1.p2 TRINITY_DN709_c0_g1~~TRINITY_DN709_c0_g1_i1.p2  ORF type:complete len:171 (-),score=43.09 TRINITY_DN709_c0_g1_i1:298-810(-)
MLGDFLNNVTKEYKATAMFGSETDTQDNTGAVLRTCDYAHVTKEALQSIIDAKFVGKIMQTPPIYSAIKVNGKPMYHLTRSGVTVQPQPRPVEVLSLRVDSFDLPRVTFRATVGSGTYIRTLVRDIADAVGSCAHLVELERTAQGPFRIENALSEAQWTVEEVQRVLQTR